MSFSDHKRPPGAGSDKFREDVPFLVWGSGTIGQSVPNIV